MNRIGFSLVLLDLGLFLICVLFRSGWFDRVFVDLGIIRVYIIFDVYWMLMLFEFRKYRFYSDRVYSDSIYFILDSELGIDWISFVNFRLLGWFLMIGFVKSNNFIKFRGWCILINKFFVNNNFLFLFIICSCWEGVLW